MTIEEYKYKGKPVVYKGKVICPICKEEYEINTTSKKIAENPLPCFMCHLSMRNVK
jgi:hypothetical protein